MINRSNFLQGKSRLRNRRRIDPSNAGQGRSRSGMTGAAAAARRAWTTHLCSSHRGRKYNASLLCGREGGGPAGRRRAPSQVLGALARPTTGQSCARKSPRAEIDIHRFWGGESISMPASAMDGLGHRSGLAAGDLSSNTATFMHKTTLPPGPQRQFP